MKKSLTFSKRQIEADFKKMFGNNGDKLKETWDVFTANNLKRLKKMIIDPEVIRVLNSLSDGNLSHFMCGL